MQQWYHLSVVPKIPGVPLYSPVWTSLGWHWMSFAQMQLLSESLSCCADTFTAYSIVDQRGAPVATMSCGQ